jgi:hypothetical protein
MRADGYDEANSRYAQFCERSWNEIVAAVVTIV